MAMNRKAYKEAMLHKKKDGVLVAIRARQQRKGQKEEEETEIEDEQDFTVSISRPLVLDFKEKLLKQGVDVRIAIGVLMERVVDGQIWFTKRRQG